MLKRLFILSLIGLVVLTVGPVYSYLPVGSVGSLHAQGTPLPQKKEEAKKISLRFKSADLREVLQLLAEECEINIAIGKDITGKVTVNLSNVTPEEALKSILVINECEYVIEDNIIIIQKKGKVRAITKVFYLNHIDASSVKDVLKNRLSAEGEVLSFIRAKGIGSEKTGDRSHILILTDTPSQIEELSKLITELDTPAPQVLIESRIMEVNLEKSTELGINWNVKVSLKGPSLPTTAPLKRDRIISPYVPSPKPAAGGAPPTEFYAEEDAFKAGILSYSDFTAMLKLIQSKGPDVNLLANPMITTLDNQAAEILIGDVVPIPRYTYNTQRASWEITGYDEQQVGITLNVTPHITPDQHIIMTVTPEVSEITGWVIGPSGEKEKPWIRTRRADTQVRVKDHETIVIGGLIKTVETKNESKVPLLGDIPILGAIFRYKSLEKKKVDLLIFITPRILTEEQVKEVSQEHQSRFETEKAKIESSPPQK